MGDFLLDSQGERRGGVWVIFEVVFRGNRGGGERFLTWFSRGMEEGGLSDF